MAYGIHSDAQFVFINIIEEDTTSWHNPLNRAVKRELNTSDVFAYPSRSLKKQMNNHANNKPVKLGRYRIIIYPNYKNVRL